MASLPTRALIAPIAAFGALATAAALVLGSLTFGGDAGGVLWSSAFLGAYAAGVIAVRARPEAVAARRLLLFGSLGAAMIAGSVGLANAFEVHGREWWLGPGNLVLQCISLGMGAAMIALVAAYPDGTYRVPHEAQLVRWVARLALLVPLVLLLAADDVRPAWVFGWEEDADAFPAIDSPVHLGALSWLAAPLSAYHDASAAVAPAVAAILMALRYRRLPAEARLQVRWPVHGALLLLLAPIGALLADAGILSVAAADVLIVAGLAALPAALVTGLVWPGVFDVSRALRRSLVYAPLWIAIAGLFIGVATAVGLAASSAGVQLAILVTVAATALLEPARRRLAGRAASWAYGEPVSGQELVRRVGATLEHTHDSDHLAREIARITRDGLGVEWARITIGGAAVVVDGQPPPDTVAEVAVPLLYGGERLGQIECGGRVRGRGQYVDRELLATLARQAALAIHNAQLATELSGRVEEVRHQAQELAASRSRIVAADESARRRIERDIHDGAQQELVALMARIGLARSQLGRDPSGMDEMFVDLQSELGQVLENLRELASGIHPSVLSDHGLVEAIEIRSRRLPIGVTIECEPELRELRFGDAVEGAAFFFVSEALANTLKHSGAAAAQVVVRRLDGRLEVEVSDDGGGFDVARASRGGGLRGLADRIEALGGRIDIRSAPGQGASLSARLPISDPAVTAVRR